MAQEKEPVHKIRYGRIRAVIWANESQGRTWFNVEIVRVYKDGDDWKDSTSFGRDDLPIAALALNKAYAWIWEQAAAAVPDKAAE